MGIYDINGNIISSDSTGDSYFEIISDITGNTLQPKSEYQRGFYRAMSLNTHFKTFFDENYSSIAPNLATMQTKGKSLYIGGDSLHAYAGGDGAGGIEGFVTDYNKYLGFSKVINDGYAGSKWTGTTGGGGIKRVTDLVTNATPYDVIILAWGTNSDTSVGTVDDEASNTSTSTCGAMKWCIEQLRSTFPKTAIGVIVPPPSSNQGTVLDEKADAMIEVCEKMNVPYVDMRMYVSTSDLSDGTHLNSGGSKKYGAAEAKLILDICSYGEPL